MGDENTPAIKPTSIKVLRSDTKLVNMLREAVDGASEETGWASLGHIGSLLNKTANDFDPRNYGFKKLSELVSAIGLFEIERRGNLLYVKDGRKK